MEKDIAKRERKNIQEFNHYIAIIGAAIVGAGLFSLMIYLRFRDASVRSIFANDKFSNLYTTLTTKTQSYFDKK